MLTVTAGLAGYSLLPFAFTPSPGPLLQEAQHAASPWTVLTAIARFLDSRPEMSLQILLFALFSLPLYLWIGDSRERRMWGVSIYLVLLLLGFVLLPILALGVPVDLAPLPGRVCAVRYNRCLVCPICPGQGCGVPLGGILDEVHPKGRGAC